MDRRQFQPLACKPIRIILKFAERDLVQRLIDLRKESFGVGSIGTLSVPASSVESEGNQMLIRFGLLRKNKGRCCRRSQPSFGVFVRMQDNAPSHA